MKRMICYAALACALSCAPVSSAAEDAEAVIIAPKGAPAAEALDWHVGSQAYTFNHYTFFEAVDKVKALGLHYIEAYPGQTLSKEDGDAKFEHGMSAELQKKALDYLKAADVKLMNYGVVGIENKEVEARKVFDFAKAMGIETIVSEPTFDSFDLLDTLTEEYGINIAIHNHPEPSRYWNPDILLEHVKDHNKRIGACADTGHWQRSGIDPVEALKKLEGRVISFHVKDLNEFGVHEAHDVPWGTGVGNLRGVLAEMQRQGFKGVFSAEYEHKWTESLPDLALSVANFNAIAESLTELQQAKKN
ncbi:MAG: sugar phosphate isomerase/epimerase [Candidatus Hydrogenedentes bacterium]|nr:sugar phosphate isomerase/epimerase [Candidatus Hydrogenedentota bacterium]